MEIGGIRGGTAANFTTQVLPNDPIQAKISSVGSSAVNPNLKLDVNNPAPLNHKGSLAPRLSKGMTAIVNTLF